MNRNISILFVVGVFVALSCGVVYAGCQTGYTCVSPQEVTLVNGSTCNWNGAWCTYDAKKAWKSCGNSVCSTGEYYIGGCKTTVDALYNIKCVSDPNTNKNTHSCCATDTTASCGEACGTCESGLTCSGGKCVNASCSTDADCVCGGGGDSCSVSITGDNSIEAGSVVFYDIGVTGDGDPETLGLSAPGFDDGEGNSTFNADGYSSASFGMYAPTEVGAYTLSASATTTKASCSKTLSVNVTQAIVEVRLRAYVSPDLSTCLNTYGRVPATATLTDVPWGGSYDQSIHSTVSEAAVFQGVPGNRDYLATVTPDAVDPPWIYVACGGQTNPSIVSLDTTTPVYHNFFFTRQAGPWFQVLGGDAGTNGDMSATIPADQTLLADNFINSSGVLLAARTASVLGGTFGQVSPLNRNWSAANSAFFVPPQEGYTYFSRLYEMGSAPTDSFGNVTGEVVMNLDEATPNKAETNPLTFRDELAYYRDGDLVVEETSINDGTSRTVFVNDDLIIGGDVTVGYGSFLAFIVKGNIIFEDTVLAAEGVYIADGVITIQDLASTVTGAANRQFVGQGIFVGWGGVNLVRDLVSGDELDVENNNFYPASQFIYRPDFLVNAPAGLKRSGIAWREVAPGTTQE